MKKFLFTAIAAAAFLSGCTEKEISEEGQIRSDAFTGVLEGGITTKTTLDGVKVNWESSDTVCINGVIYTATPDGADAAKATFTKKNPGDAAPTSPFKAFFANGNGDGAWDGEKYTLPAAYTYKEGKFNMPMYADTTGRELRFKNLCGVLQLSLTDSTATSVSKLVISSENQLNGQFTANSKGELTFCSKTLADDDKKVTVNFSSPVALGETATVFFIPVAPGSHKLTVTVYNGENSSFITMAGAYTFDRNALYTLSDGKLHHTGGDPDNAR